MLRADKLVEDAKREEKRGFSLDENRKSPGAGLSNKKLDSKPAAAEKKQHTEESDIADDYVDDFDDDIEEDLPPSEGERDPAQEEKEQRDQAAVTGSGGYGITVS